LDSDAISVLDEIYKAWENENSQNDFNLNYTVEQERVPITVLIEDADYPVFAKDYYKKLNL
jgi:hypothetical protein